MCLCVLPAWPEVKVNEITTAADLLPPHHPLGLMSHNSAVAAGSGDTREHTHTLSLSLATQALYRAHNHTPPQTKQGQ